MISPQIYQLPGAAWQIMFSTNVLSVFEKHRQTRARSSESVGQLFCADLTRDDVVVVEEATILRPVNASSHGVVFSTEQANRERSEQFDRGLHCVGLWHSHPQSRPTPSSIDLQLAVEHARAAQENLTGILFVIVGTADFPDGLFVSVHDGTRLHAADSYTEPRLPSA